jgi:hypothetical protein
MRDYILVTVAYWAFTLTDGALRMLVLLHFHDLGFSPVELAFLFLFYELFGVVTNLLGGWLASVTGLRVTLLGGLLLQVVALLMLSAVDPGWSKLVSVVYVMGTQSLSGIAKDLTKMSAKSSLKVLVPEGARSSLFRWVAALTGSKNALKGVGFFLGGLLLAGLGYVGALYAMAGGLALVLALAAALVPGELGKAKAKAAFEGLFSKTRAVNVLSAARFFLFGARDIWFVVGVPVFLAAELGWSFTGVGAFLALWVIGYGAVQAMTPALMRRFVTGGAPQGRSAEVLSFLLAVVTAAVALGLFTGRAPQAASSAPCCPGCCSRSAACSAVSADRSPSRWRPVPSPPGCPERRTVPFVRRRPDALGARTSARWSPCPRRPERPAWRAARAGAAPDAEPLLREGGIR